LEKKTEVLIMDKSYLSKELETLQMKVDFQEEKLSSQKMKMKSLKKGREDALQQLIHVKEDHRLNFEQRVNAELERLRNQTTIELDLIKGNTKDYFERESKYFYIILILFRSLKSTLDRTLMENEKLRLKLEEKERIQLSLTEE
jgi:hypothetical protein